MTLKGTTPDGPLYAVRGNDVVAVIMPIREQHPTAAVEATSRHFETPLAGKELADYIASTGKGPGRKSVVPREPGLPKDLRDRAKVKQTEAMTELNELLDQAIPMKQAADQMQEAASKRHAAMLVAAGKMDTPDDDAKRLP